MLLEWDGHDKALATKLWEFLKEEYLVDFYTTCHGQQMKVHKFILALMFPMLKESFRSSGTFSFKQELANERSPEESSIIPETHCLNLDNITNHPEDMGCLIQFAYTGKTTVPKEHTDCLLHIANNMEIKSLKDSLDQWHNNNKLEDNSEKNAVQSLREMHLEWRNHDKALTEKLFEFLNEGYLVDYNATCHGHQVPVHKFVLAFMFPVLKEALKSSATFSLNEEVMLSGSSLKIPHGLNLDSVADHAEDMDYLIQFAYTGMTTVPEEHVNCLMRIAKSMQVMSLSDSLGQRLVMSEPAEEPQQTETIPLSMLIPRDVIKKEVPEISGDIEPCPASFDDNDYDQIKDEDEDDGYDRNYKRSRKKETVQNRASQMHQSEIGQSNERTKESYQKLEEKATNGNPPKKLGRKMGVFQCRQCDFVAKYKTHLKHHVKEHGRKEPAINFTCEICKKGFEHSMAFEVHCISKCETLLPFVCKYCGHETNVKQCLLRHVMVKHHIDEDGNKMEKNVKCPKCDYVCYARHQLGVHLRVKHDHRFKCKDCDFTAHDLYLITQHERVKHQNRRDFECGECGKRYPTSSSLGRHVLFTHVGVKPYRCEICGEGCSCKVSYILHKESHNGNVENLCRTCGYRAENFEALKIHRLKEHDMKTYITNRPCGNQSLADSSLKSDESNKKKRVLPRRIAPKPATNTSTQTN